MVSEDKKVRSNLKIYYEADCDINVLKGKTVAVIGYGARRCPARSA